MMSFVGCIRCIARRKSFLIVERASSHLCFERLYNIFKSVHSLKIFVHASIPFSTVLPTINAGSHQVHQSTLVRLLKSRMKAFPKSNMEFILFRYPDQTSVFKIYFRNARMKLTNFYPIASFQGIPRATASRLEFFHHSLIKRPLLNIML